MDEELVTDSLVYRYDPAASPDGLAGDEGTFSLCTFNYVDALAGAGRLDEARLVFEKMLTYANHVGLYSEEVGANGEQLGNFPQAFTHLALVNAALTLDAALDAPDQGRARPPAGVPTPRLASAPDASARPRRRPRRRPPDAPTTAAAGRPDVHDRVLRLLLEGGAP